MRPIIIDANNICHIQYHAFGDTLSYEEQQTGIMWGFFNQIFRTAERFDSNRFIFAWDSQKSYRKLFYPRKSIRMDGKYIIEGYKANRGEATNEYAAEIKSDIYDQFDLLRKELLPRFGFKNIYLQPGIEADDIIATLVLNTDWDEKPVVVTTDKDLFQLLGHCDIFRPVNKEIVTWKEFQEKYTIAPTLWVDVKAMAGDVSDNIPGLKGVGEKTAIKFLRGELSETTQAHALIISNKGQEIIIRNKRLMSLPYEGTAIFNPIPDGIFDQDAWMEICNRYGFRSMETIEARKEYRDRFQPKENGK